jgi:hypothetical protein
MNPGCIPDISQINSGYIPDLSNIPDLSRIYPGFIPNDRCIRDSSVYPAYIPDSKAGGYQLVILFVNMVCLTVALALRSFPTEEAADEEADEGDAPRDEEGPAKL